MTPGKKYRIRYRIPGVYNRPREMVAKFLEARPAPLSKSGEPDYIFNGRPQFGTTELNSSYLVADPVEVPETVACYSGRMF